MKNQTMGLRVLFAMILFFQSEASQARTVQECTQCTAQSCSDADDKEWCVKNCGLDLIPDCLRVSPKLKSVIDANRYGDIRRAEILNRAYQKFPLSKYFLDLNTPEEPGRERDKPLNDEEKHQLKEALQDLEKGCQDIAHRLEYSKGEKISAKTLLGSLEQIRDSLNKAKADFAAINTAPFTRYEVKIAFDRASLNIKTCFNQGEGAIFQANEKGSFIDKATAKFNCSLKCSAKNCKKDPAAYDKCLENCPASQIGSCIRTVSEAKPKVP